MAWCVRCWGGDVSTDMRAILLSGAHPMMDRARTQPADSAMMDPAPMVAAARRAEPNGLAQIIGLALGSPEFQRR